MNTNAIRCTLASALVLALSAHAAQGGPRGKALTIDIAGDCNRFVTEGKGHLDPELNPVYGDNFMQEGIIYKGGTFEEMCPETMDCGLHEDGTPEFPEKVIGKWTCYGAFVGNGIATEEGGWIASTQNYDFHVEELSPNVYSHGRHGMTSLGIERVDEVPFYRSVTGGYGRFKGVAGEVKQVKVGFNQTTCENFTFTFDIRRHRRH